MPSRDLVLSDIKLVHPEDYSACVSLPDAVLFELYPDAAVFAPDTARMSRLITKVNLFLNSSVSDSDKLRVFEMASLPNNRFYGLELVRMELASYGFEDTDLFTLDDVTNFCANVIEFPEKNYDYTVDLATEFVSVFACLLRVTRYDSGARNGLFDDRFNWLTEKLEQMNDRMDEFLAESGDGNSQVQKSSD